MRLPPGEDGVKEGGGRGGWGLRYFEYVWKYFQYSLTIDISGEYTH